MTHTSHSWPQTGGNLSVREPLMCHVALAALPMLQYMRACTAPHPSRENHVCHNMHMYMFLYVVVHAKPYAEAQRKWPPWKYNWRVDVAIPPTLKAERCRKGCTTDVLAARRAHCPNSHPHHPISMRVDVAIPP